MGNVIRGEQYGWVLNVHRQPSCPLRNLCRAANWARPPINATVTQYCIVWYMGKRRVGHRQSLGDQLENPQLHGVRVYPHKKKMRKSHGQQETAEEVDADQSSKILALAKDQQQEVDREDTHAPGAEGAGAAQRTLSLGACQR